MFNGMDKVLAFIEERMCNLEQELHMLLRYFDHDDEQIKQLNSRLEELDHLKKLILGHCRKA
jgi:archaellum component FlaC